MGGRGMVTRGANRRLTRVGESIREALSKMLIRTMDDPRLSWVTITDVEVSPDLRNARAFYVVTAGGADKETVGEILGRAASFMQGELGRSLKLRYTPKLNFVFDGSFDAADRIDRLIGEVQRDRGEGPPPSPERALARLVSESEAILVITHRNPDGDAIGSLLGFSRILHLLGKRPVTYCPDGVPKVLSFLDGVDRVVEKLDDSSSFDLTVCLDTADEKLFPPGLPGRSRMGTLAIIDHHEIHGNVGEVVIRREASSVGEILFNLQKELIWPGDAKVAECLYTSIVADTGSFRYSNTTPDTHRAAAELVASGARAWLVATALFESFPVKRQRLLALVLDTLTLACDGAYGLLWCTPEMLRAAGAVKEDLDNMVNFARAVDTVEVAAMFRVEPEGDVKVSFRSKGKFDVARLASRFGGGGHRNAAGCTLKQTPLDEAKALMERAVTRLLESGTEA
jgi:phosphoesterase RecJ-like protein